MNVEFIRGVADVLEDVTDEDIARCLHEHFIEWFQEFVINNPYDFYKLIQEYDLVDPIANSMKTGIISDELGDRFVELAGSETYARFILPRLLTALVVEKTKN